MSDLCACCELKPRQKDDPFAFDVCSWCEMHMRLAWARPLMAEERTRLMCPKYREEPVHV